MALLAKRTVQYNLLLILIVAASCLRVFVCFQHNPMDYLGSDMARHWDNGLHFPRGGYNAGADPIGYQVYVFVLQKLTAGNRFLVAAACSLLSVLMPWTFYRAARNFGLAKIPSLWVWALIGWTPSLVVIFHFIMMETLLLLLEGVALWTTARYLRKGGTKPFLLSTFCWMLAILTKPTVIPLAGICFLWAWWKRSTPLRDIAVGAVLATSMLVPHAVRTKLELGFIAPFGNTWLPRIALRAGTRTISFHFYRFDGGDETLVFGNPSCFIRPLEPASHWAMRRAWGESNASFTIMAAHGERDWKEVYERFNHDPAEWWAQWRENIILFFFAPSWPETAVGEWDGHFEYRGRWLWAPLTLFVFVCNLRGFARRRFDLIPVAVTLFTLFMALQNLAILEGRYRKPVEPLLLLNLVWVLSSRNAGALPTGEPGLAPA